MANDTRKNSSYIRLNSYCLVEYIKTDINDPGTEKYSGIKATMFEYPALSYKQIYYDDGYIKIEGANFRTQNVKKYSVFNYDSTRYASVMSVGNETNLVEYIANAGKIILNGKYDLSSYGNVIYDTYRFHFANGFDVSKLACVVLGIRYRQNNGNYINVATMRVDANNWFDYTDDVNDSLIEYNPSPIYLNDASFPYYMDIRVPSLTYLNREYQNSETESSKINTFCGALTDLKYNTFGSYSPNGFNVTAPVSVFCDDCEDSDVYRVSSGGSYIMYNISNHYEGSIAQQNVYERVSCDILESNEGNYFEFRAEYNGAQTPHASIDSFLYAVSNGNPSEWSIIHQINVVEHVDDKLGGVDDYITAKNTLYQDSSGLGTDAEASYGDYMQFRPILKYSGRGCMSFSLNYTMTLVNNRTGEQVVRTASILSYNVRSYGKNTNSIDISKNTIMKQNLFNKIYVSKDSSTDLFVDPEFEKYYREGSGSTTVVEKAVIYPLYVDFNAICVSDDVSGSQELTSTNVVYKQGDLRILLKPLENRLRFKVYTIADGKKIPISLDATNTYKIAFLINGNKVTFDADRTDQLFATRMSMGELSFTIPETDSVSILNSETRDFYILYDNYSTLQTSILYFGFFFTQNEYKEYNKYIADIKTEYDSVAEAKVRIDEIINSAQQQTETIPNEIYIPGNIDQASDGNEVSNVYKTIPTSQNS